mgnify:CR=1 FL=1
MSQIISREFFTNLQGVPTEAEVNNQVEFNFDCGLTAIVNSAGFVTVRETGTTQGASAITFGWRFDGQKFAMRGDSPYLAKCLKKNSGMFAHFRFKDIQKVVDSITVE